MLEQNTLTCHNIIAFHSILIARIVKPASKTKNNTQAKLGSLAKAGTTGKERSASLQNIDAPINDKQKKRAEVLHPVPLILLLPVLKTTLILLLTKMMMLSWLVFQIIPFYLSKNCKVKFLTMTKTTKMMTMTTMATTIILDGV